MFKIIKKADIVLFIILIVIGLFLSYLAFTGNESGKTVVISVSGEEYGTYDLNENQTITISHNNHTNKITIKDHKVQMTYSDCKNQVCVDTGAIESTSQTIVCLPNEILVEIKGGEEEYDAISK